MLKPAIHSPLRPVVTGIPFLVTAGVVVVLAIAYTLAGFFLVPRLLSFDLHVMWAGPVSRQQKETEAGGCRGAWLGESLGGAVRTRIFSPVSAGVLSVAIGRYVCLSCRLVRLAERRSDR